VTSESAENIDFVNLKIGDIILQAELAQRLGVSIQTLGKWRREDSGPTWFRLGPRKIAYLRADVNEWLARKIVVAGW
jgi:predicted DNA-binding transcriptional regulator AlpA